MNEKQEKQSIMKNEYNNQRKREYENNRKEKFVFFLPKTTALNAESSELTLFSVCAEDEQI